MRRGDLPVQPAREGAPGFTLLPRGAADAPPQTRLRFSGQHRDAAVLSGSWSPDALIESLRPCRNQRGGERRGRRGEYEGRGGGVAKTHIWHPQNPADSRKTSPRETYGPCSRWRLGRKRSAFVFPPLSQRRQESRTPTAPGK